MLGIPKLSLENHYAESTPEDCHPFCDAFPALCIRKKPALLMPEQVDMLFSMLQKYSLVEEKLPHF